MLSLSNVIIIAKHEIMRFKSRFQGKNRFAVIIIALIAISIFFFMTGTDFLVSKGFYRVGMGSGSSEINDPRFTVLNLEQNSGLALLNNKTIDIYIDTDRAFYRADLRSQYAAGALKQYLGKKELVRIANECEIDRAFPLRVEINHIKTDTSKPGNITLADIINVSRTQATEGVPNPETFATFQQVPIPGLTEEAVKIQLDELGRNTKLPKFEAEFVSDKEIVIPSLMTPPIPLAQVLLVFFYIVPVFFIIIFFTSSFIEEKLNRRLSILLSTPVRPIEIILGKMLPYFIYSLIVTLAITLILKGNILLSFVIFIPVMLFIFGIYLGVALLYRTFKDQTFFSMLAVTSITVFLVFPAMFNGINNLSYISPLSLAMQMYQGQSFGINEYLFSTGPMYLVFALSLIIGTRVFNEEYLMNFKPLFKKISEAIYFALDKKRLLISIFALSLLLIPVVFIIQLAGIVFAFNLPMPFALWLLLLAGVIIEETAKSAGIAVLIKHNLIRSRKHVVILAIISALSFFLGEKILLYFSMSIISESIFTNVLFGSGLIWLPLIVHSIATCIVSLLTYRLGTKYYVFALLMGSAVHLVYNLSIMGSMR
jgi:hypothetical protein